MVRQTLILVAVALNLAVTATALWQVSLLRKELAEQRRAIPTTAPAPPPPPPGQWHTTPNTVDGTAPWPVPR